LQESPLRGKTFNVLNNYPNLVEQDMKSWRSMLVAAGLLTLNQTVMAAEPTYPFVCRGPMAKTNFIAHSNGMGALQFEFKRTTRGGGVTGAVLPPGSCAWRERPVSATESTFFYFDYNTQAAELIGATAVQECLSRADCVISVEAYANSIVNNAIYTSFTHGGPQRLINQYKP
jgi:hypothetical protein